MCVGGNKRGRDPMPLCNKKGSDTDRKGPRLGFESCKQEQFIHYSFEVNKHLNDLSLLSFQLDYTEAGTCNLCFEKRKNVSNAARPCNCTVVFNIKKAFKVTTTKFDNIVFTLYTQHVPVPGL